MGKTYRYDAEGDGDTQAPLSRKELKDLRRQRQTGKDSILDDQMKSDDEDNRTAAW